MQIRRHVEAIKRRGGAVLVAKLHRDKPRLYRQFEIGRYRLYMLIGGRGIDAITDFGNVAAHFPEGRQEGIKPVIEKAEFNPSIDRHRGDFWDEGWRIRVMLQIQTIARNHTHDHEREPDK